MKTRDAQLDVNLLLVEDHPALRRGLELLLRSIGCHIVGAAQSVERGYALFQLCRPDIVVADHHLTDGLATDLLARIRAEDPTAKVVVYTGSTESSDHAAIVASGASGLALKGSDVTTLFDAVRVVAAGGTYVDPRAHVAPAPARNVLTDRQSQILTLLAAGLTGAETADRLVLSPETVKTHVRNAMGRLGAHTRAHAVTRAALLHEIS